MLFSDDGTGKISCIQVRRREDVPLPSHCSLLRNPSPYPAYVLEHCREGETNFFFPFFGSFPSDRIPKATKGVNVHLFIYSSYSSTFYHKIPVNYTSEFREIFEATKYNQK
jgi:hypothetical protein